MSANETRTDDRRNDLRRDVEATSVANPRRVRWTEIRQD